MSKKHQLSIALSAVIGLCVAGAVSADPLPPVRIMPMGDSITDGVPVAGGYRDLLYTLLNNRGDSFTFVGSLSNNDTAALIAAGQTHHEGHSGYVITNGTGRAGLDENLATWIGPGAESPDKILLMIGSNDINLGYDMPNAPVRLSALIDHIYGYRPGVKLYVASIIPMVGHEADVQAFNAAIPGVVASHRALGQDVVYVPMYEALNISTDLADGLHPNALGYLHMAQAWDTALHTTPSTHAVDVMSAGDGATGGSSFSVGWDFTVSQAIIVTALGQFDPDSNPQANTVAIYQRGGSKLVEAAVAATSPAELSGNYSARYVPVTGTLLSPGNYVVFSTQNGDNFIAGGGSPATIFGSAITWNKGVAQDAGPLPATAPATWQIENADASRYFGPTFKYDVAPVVPALPVGQQTLSLTGWNSDIIVGKSEAAPGYNATMAGWDYYEAGLSGGTQGLAADEGATPRTFTCAQNPRVQFQFAPYDGNNAVYLAGPASATLTLATPAKFYSLQFLETTRSMSWYARLNFSDGTSRDTPTWNDPDWTANPGPADWCLASYGLRGTGGNFYDGYLWMAGREFTLSATDQAKTLKSITICTTSTGDKQLALFAVSGYVLGADPMHAVDVTSSSEGSGFGDTFSVGWEFTVSQAIRVTSLGQFDPDSNPKDNTVAIYRRAGAKLVEAAVSASSPSEPSGNYPARYAEIGGLVLPPGDYVVFSTQNGDNFIAPGGSVAATFGPGVTWTKCMALDWGSAAGPLPDTAPENWPIQGVNPWRYFGPTFKYELVVPPPTLALVSPANDEALGASASIYAVAAADNTVAAYTVHVYTNSGSGAFAEAGAGGSTSPYHVDLGALPVGTYRIYATVTDSLATTITATNTFTVVVKTAQQTLALTGWNQDIIIGKSEAAPGYNGTFAGWNFYETGMPGGSQGLAAEAGAAHRAFTSSRNPSVQFQFAPYAGNNALYLQETASATLTLVNPARFLSLQFLETTRTMGWYARLNFADGSSTDTDTWYDPDWTTSPGPADRCLTSYGLKLASTGYVYDGYLWMAGREFTLPVADQSKTLTSITIHTLGGNDQQLALFAVSGYALAPSLDVAHAVDVNTINEGPVGGDTFSVGWDFTVSQTITVTALGQFDPDSNPQANTVALYQRGGAKLAEVTVSADSPAEQSGICLARYAKIGLLVLPPGDYVVFSTQNGDNFIGSYSSAFGPAVRWNKGVALGGGSAAGPLPTTAPASWPIEDSGPWRYFGPTFRYKMGAVWPDGTKMLLR